VAIQCSDCGAILEAEAPGETRKPCACGSTARTHEQSAAAIVSTSSVSAAVSVERGLNDTRLAVLGIIVAIGLTVGFGVDGAWFVRVAWGAGALALALIVIRWRWSRRRLMALMYWLTGQ
jgi:hypothetical protein